MRRFTTLFVAIAAMVALLALPAGAATLDELQDAVAQAQASVDFWEDEVERLDGEIDEAQQAIDAQQTVVDGLQRDLEAAEENLKEAKDRLTELTAYRAHCDTLPTNPERNQCRNPTNPEFNALTDDVVPALEQVVDGIAGDLEDAESILADLREDMQELVDEKSLAEADLLLAQQALAKALAALDAYNPAGAHPGCKGINNAQEQVAKNVPVKGKAPAALAAVADKLGC